MADQHTNEPGNLKLSSGLGANITCVGRDLHKLSTPDGCFLKVVTEKPSELDDLADSEDDEAEFFHDSSMDEAARLERMKREYLSIAINANRDPIEPESDSRLKSSLLRKGNEQNNDLFAQGGNFTYDRLVDGFRRKYPSPDNFNSIIEDQANGFLEISPNRVFKRDASPGLGPLITENSLVVYNYSCWTEKAKDPYDSTWIRRNAMISDLTTDPILPGLRELLLSMRRGELCEAFIRPEAAFGRLGVTPRVPPNATIYCLIEVIKAVAKDSIKMTFGNSEQADSENCFTFDDLYAASDEARKRGNHFSGLKQYRAALQRYKSGIRIIEGLIFKDEHQESKAMKLLVRLYNNSARVANALGDPRLALTACKQATLIDDMEPKTHWHRIIAWKKKGHMDKAFGCAKRAIQLFKDDSRSRKVFELQANELRTLIQTAQAEQNELYRLMAKAILN